MLAQGPEVRIAGQPFEVAIAQGEGFFQGAGGHVKFAVERVAASEVVENERVAGFEPGKALVYFEAAVVGATLGIMIAQNLEGLDVMGVAPDDPFHESDLDFQLAHFFASQLLILAYISFRHETS